MNFAVRKRRAPSIIIVSLVDILIILLIFFVVSTTFKKDQPEVQINLPESKTATKAPAELEHAIVTVDEADAIKLDGRPVDVGVALVRAAAAIFSALVLGLGFFWAGWDRGKQSWHDKIAGTVMVTVPKGMPLL